MNRGPTVMALCYALTMFMSALLLFMVQPMIAKAILPIFGGTPAVWNTCIVFFQVVLLAGYCYDHASTSWLGARRQALLHLGLLLIPLLVMRFSVDAESWAPEGSSNPVPQLLMLLAASVGLPFFMLSTTAPLLQKWFADTGHESSRDPYFLYAASNLGSMLALLAYPLIIEPRIPLQEQARLWWLGYVAQTLMLLLCAGIVSMARRLPEAPRQRPEAWAAPGADAGPHAPGAPENYAGWTRLRWVLLAFIPSSLMLGVTTYLSTDIAPIPLIWVVPLALYLLTFILVFSRLPVIVPIVVRKVLPMLVLFQTALMLSQSTLPLWLTYGLHLLSFFAICMVCHGELARTRPAARQLTEFYLAMSLGGTLGGMFNAFVAPALFRSVAEYPLMLVLGCLVMPASGTQRNDVRARLLDLCVPILVGAIALALLLGHGHPDNPQASRLVPVTLVFAIPIFMCYTFAARPIRFGLGVAAILGAHAIFAGWGMSHVLRVERNFYGILKVDRMNGQHRLLHGTTVHGSQHLDEHDRPLPGAVPGTYYHPDGPIGKVFDALTEEDAARPVALIGLGAGALTYYGRPEQEMTFYEIDPAVVRIAADTRFFTYLEEGKRRGVRLDIVLGDARLSLRHAPARHFRLLVVDAFSSDAVPVHLITREALQLYLDKLTADGVIALHISNRYLDLQPVLANLAADAGLVGVSCRDLDHHSKTRLESHWVVLARQPRELEQLHRHDERARPLVPRPDLDVWTDDFSNLVSVLMWRR